MTMVLTGLTIAFLGWIDEDRRQWLLKRIHWSPLPLVLAVVSLGCLGPLFHTYRLYPQLWKANEQNFDSDFRRDKKQMSFSVLPSEGIIIEKPIPLGTYAKPPVLTGFSYEVYPFYLLGFFDKQMITIRPFDGSGNDARSSSSPR